MTEPMQLKNTVERRSGKDRRSQSGISIRSLLMGGKRAKIRRQDDRYKFVYVDQYSQSLFGAIVLILLLSVLDALLTLLLMDHGAAEINPIMAYYLNIGPYTFLSVKYMLTSMGVIILLMLRNIFLRAIKLYTHSLFYFIILMFASVVAWEFYLIFDVII